MRIVFDSTTYNKLSALMQIIVMVFLFSLSLFPIKDRWTDADLLLVRMLPSICILGALSLLLCKEKTGITAVDILLLVFTLYYSLNSWIESKYPCISQSLKVVSLFFLYVGLRMLFSSRRVTPWVLIALLLLCGSIEAIWGIVQLIGGGNHAQKYLVTGNFVNPGPYSAYLSIGVVTGLTLLADKGKNKIVFASVVLMLTVLPSTWSRAAFLSIGLSALWLFRVKYYKYRFIVIGGIVLIAILFYYLKKGSANGRLLIWLATLLSWRHTPLLGVGTGGFIHNCSEGIEEMYISNIMPSLLNTAGVAENSFNLYLKIWVEQGIVGFLLFTVILLFFLKELHSSCRPLFYGMVTLLIISMFSYPLELLPYQILLVTVAAWSESCRRQYRTILGTIMIALLYTFIITMGGAFIRKTVHERFLADREASLLSSQRGEDLMDDFHDLLKLEEDNPQFLYDYAIVLYESERFNESISILKKGTMVSADPMFYVMIGNNYSKLSKTKEAELAYTKAYGILPNRLYPLYQLMLLYSDTGQDEKASKIAKEIIEMKPKVESPATRDMKESAKTIMTKNLYQ